MPAKEQMHPTRQHNHPVKKGKHNTKRSTFQNLDKTCPERRFPPAFCRRLSGQKSYYSRICTAVTPKACRYSIACKLILPNRVEHHLKQNKQSPIMALGI